MSRATTGPSLLVFSDDWGRHPSSCQHLIRRLAPAFPVCWVNTIGTRARRLDRATIRRALEKIRHWGGSPADATSALGDVQVVNPRMWPWFTHRHDRRLNRYLLERQLRPIIESLPGPVTAVTTLPITADLVGRLPVERWVYYCVDDFSQWPGLDGATLARMDADLIRSVDEIVAVSTVLQSHVARHGRESQLLTHGVELDHWQPAVRPSPAAELAGLELPLVLFWGVVDRRMDTALVTRLASKLKRGTVVLVGPQSDPDPGLWHHPRIVHRPAVPYDRLPSLAAEAAVLIMPYDDLPVTRAMQPLKLKEYLATGQPVVVRDLPAVAEWADCLDTAHSADEFAVHVLWRLETGTSTAQRAARRRLQSETWDGKARQFARYLRPGSEPVACPDTTVETPQLIGACAGH